MKVQILLPPSAFCLVLFLKKKTKKKGTTLSLSCGRADRQARERLTLYHEKVDRMWTTEQLLRSGRAFFVRVRRNKKGNSSGGGNKKLPDLSLPQSEQSRQSTGS